MLDYEKTTGSNVCKINDVNFYISHETRALEVQRKFLLKREVLELRTVAFKLCVRPSNCAHISKFPQEKPNKRAVYPYIYICVHR